MRIYTQNVRRLVEIRSCPGRGASVRGGVTRDPGDCAQFKIICRVKRSSPTEGLKFIIYGTTEVLNRKKVKTGARLIRNFVTVKKRDVSIQ